MTKITILHSTANWLTQTQTWLYSQIKNIDSEVFESHIICEETLNLDQFDIKNVHARQNMNFFYKRLLRLYEYFFINRRSAHVLTIGKEVNAIITHSHFGNRAWLDLPSVEKIACKHVVTFYGYDVNQLPLQQAIWKKRYLELFSQADLFLCEGAFMAQSLVKLGCDKKKITVQHLGVATEKILYQPRVWKQGTPLKILIAAGFREKKGIPYALKAISGIGNDASVEVTIIGDATDKPDSIKEKEIILQTVKDLGLERKIKFLGFQSHQVMFDEAYKHHIFLSPSVTAKDGDSEGGAPVSIIEMIATGMIIVSTSHCDIPEVVNYPVNNWLADERDIDTLVLRLQWLIGNPSKWKDLQESGRKHIEQEYDSKIQGKKLSKIYNILLGMET